MLGPDQELSFKLDSIVFKTLGESASRGLDQQFDMERARSSLEFFRSQQVPSVDPALPAGVSGVRFDSNLEFPAPVQSASKSFVRWVLFVLRLFLSRR